MAVLMAHDATVRTYWRQSVDACTRVKGGFVCVERTMRRKPCVELNGCRLDGGHTAHLPEPVQALGHANLDGSSS